MISVSVTILSHIHLLYLNKSFPKETIESSFVSLKKKYGIDFVYEIGDNFFSPLEVSIIPAGPPKSSKVKPIRHRALLKYPHILLTAFKKYPIGVIKKYLKSIYFSGEINDRGFYYAGSYDIFRRIIYLVNDGWQDDLRSEATFHHEFSSLLLKSHSLLLNPWFDQNPPGFEYNNNVELDRKFLTGKKEYYEKGFLNSYSLTWFENDFNEFSSMIFTYPKKFKQIMEKYPRIRGKFLVWLKLYQEVDPCFTEEYFFGSTKYICPTSDKEDKKELSKGPTAF